MVRCTKLIDITHTNSLGLSIDKLLKIIGAFSLAVFVSSCGGSDKRPCELDVSKCIIEAPEPEPVEVWWDVPIPDFSDDPERPTISLLGERTQILNLGEFYLEDGAIAADDQDGDISSQLEIIGEVNTDQIGDYLIRYAVTDSDGNSAIEKVRVVRVIGSYAESLTKRPLGTTLSNFAYFEHLPVNYGDINSDKPPLIIYLHGSGGNLEFTRDTDPVTSMDAVLENYGIPKLIFDDEWDNNLPFVVVAPHLGGLETVGYKERLDAFVEYAIRAYDIDVNRIYMTGYSSGGFLTSAYTADFPEKIAAIAPLAAGSSVDVDDLPEHFCNIAEVPIWLFHGTGDDVVSHNSSVSLYNAILDNCQPRVLPKLSLLLDAEHHIHHAIFDFSAMVGGSQNVEYDPTYDQYDTSIFEWFLGHSLNDRP